MIYSRQLTYSSSNENVTIISIHLLKPSISELSDNQGYWNSLDKHVKMVISNDEKEKIIKLISNVLPRVFGDTFSVSFVVVLICLIDLFCFYFSILLPEYQTR